MHFTTDQGFKSTPLPVHVELEFSLSLSPRYTTILSVSTALLFFKAFWVVSRHNCKSAGQQKLETEIAKAFGCPFIAIQNLCTFGSQLVITHSIWLLTLAHQMELPAGQKKTPSSLGLLLYLEEMSSIQKSAVKAFVAWSETLSPNYSRTRDGPTRSTVSGLA